MNVVRINTATNLNLLLIAWLNCSWQTKNPYFSQSSTTVLYHITQRSTTHYIKRQNNRTSHTS